MGRGSETSTNKYDRMKAFYEKFGKKWKENIKPDNTTYWIRELSKFAITDAFGNIRDPLIEEKIDRIQKYALALCKHPKSHFDVLCKDCHVCIFRQGITFVTLEEFEGIKCQTPRKCK